MKTYLIITVLFIAAQASFARAATTNPTLQNISVNHLSDPVNGLLLTSPALQRGLIKTNKPFRPLYARSGERGDERSLVGVSRLRLVSTTVLPTPQDTLQPYAGRYEQNKDGKIAQVDVVVENGQLVGTSLFDGRQLHLDNVGGNYTIKELGAPFKFIKDNSNNVTGILVAGADRWTKVDGSLPPHGVKPGQEEYVGKYQLMMNGQAMVIQITIKHGKLWGIPLFGGPESPLEYISGDDYNINTANWPLKFIRDKDNKVSQMLFNSKDLFTRVK